MSAVRDLSRAAARALREKGWSKWDRLPQIELPELPKPRTARVCAAIAHDFEAGATTELQRLLELADQRYPVAGLEGAPWWRPRTKRHQPAPAPALSSFHTRQRGPGR